MLYLHSTLPLHTGGDEYRLYYTLQTYQITQTDYLPSASEQEL